VNATHVVYHWMLLNNPANLSIESSMQATRTLYSSGSQPFPTRATFWPKNFSTTVF